MSSPVPSRIALVLGYFLICFIWGTTWLAIKVSIFTLPPFFSAGIRFALSALLIMLVLKIRGYKYRFDLKEISFLLVIGLASFSVPYGLVYWAEQKISSGLAAVTFAVMPFFTAILSRFFLRIERLSLLKVLGIVIGFAGLILIFGGDLRVGSLGAAVGILAVAFSAFLNAAVVVAVKKHGHDIDPLYINLIPMALGAVTLLGTSLVVENWSRLNLNLTTAAAILYLAVFGSVVAFAVYFFLLKHISAVFLSMTSFVTPVIAIFAGAMLLGEKFPSGTLYGSAMILAGVLLMNLWDSLPVPAGKTAGEVRATEETGGPGRQ